MPIATIKIKLRIFPTPRYERNAKSDNDTEMIRPRRELAKIKEKVKRRAANRRAKNRAMVPKTSGLTK